MSNHPTTTEKPPILKSIYQIFGILTLLIAAVIAFFAYQTGGPTELMICLLGGVFMSATLFGVAEVIGYIHSIAYWTERGALSNIENSSGTARMPSQTNKMQPSPKSAVPTFQPAVKQTSTSPSTGQDTQTTNSSSIWYVLGEDGSVGEPLTTAQVKALLASGGLSQDASVNKDGKQWKHASDFPELFE